MQSLKDSLKSLLKLLDVSIYDRQTVNPLNYKSTSRTLNLHLISPGQDFGIHSEVLPVTWLVLCTARNFIYQFE